MIVVQVVFFVSQVLSSMERVTRQSLQITTVSALKQLRGSIFQNRFLGGVQFKKSLKKKPKKVLFTLHGALFESGVVLERIR